MEIYNLFFNFFSQFFSVQEAAKRRATLAAKSLTEDQLTLLFRDTQVNDDI